MKEKTAQIAVRMPLSLIAEVDAFAASIELKLPGVLCNRADAIRILLSRALKLEGCTPDPTKKDKK